MKKVNQITCQGVGFKGEGSYEFSENGERLPVTTAWLGMLRRCYGKNKANGYKNCKVSEDWHNFQNFAKWYYEQPCHTWDKVQVDKDILSKGGSLYSADTCLLLPRTLNNYAVKMFTANGCDKLPHGSYRMRVYHKGERL